MTAIRHGRSATSRGPRRVHSSVAAPRSFPTSKFAAECAKRSIAPPGDTPDASACGRVARREREVRARALAMIEMLQLSHLAGTYAGALSGGQRKLVELGRALMSEPRMILLDEPMAGVAPLLAQQLLDHIQRLRAERGITVLVIEHDMDVVMTISDRVIVMDEGRVIAEGPPGEIQRNERVIEAYLGRIDTEPEAP